MVSLFRQRAAEAGVELVANLPPGIADASLDKAQMEEALANLVTNAIDACRARDERDGRVEVRVGDEDGALIFEVADNGCGMDAETRRRIFTRFFTTKDSKGTGLGLLSARKIVLEHGGTVGVSSTEGVGSRFRIRLPRERLPSPMPQTGEPAGSPATDADDHPPR
jgi:signal transduction histidine kinase